MPAVEAVETVELLRGGPFAKEFMASTKDARRRGPNRSTSVVHVWDKQFDSQWETLGPSISEEPSQPSISGGDSSRNFGCPSPLSGGRGSPSGTDRAYRKQILDIFKAEPYTRVPFPAPTSAVLSLQLLKASLLDTSKMLKVALLDGGGEFGEVDELGGRGPGQRLRGCGGWGRWLYHPPQPRRMVTLSHNATPLNCRLSR